MKKRNEGKNEKKEKYKQTTERNNTQEKKKRENGCAVRKITDTKKNKVKKKNKGKKINRYCEGERNEYSTRKKENRNKE